MTNRICLARLLEFRGNRLRVNLSTSAGGTMQVEMQDEYGLPLPGYSLDDRPPYRMKPFIAMMKYVLIIAFLCSAIQRPFCQESYRTIEGTRQIHLDFHTSGLIEGIGASFSKDQFKAALRKGNVNSVNLFAKGHHGYSYYDTQIGTKHPHLDFDLFRAQVEACHEIGIRAQAYFTVGWSQKDADDHPEWIVMDKSGHNQVCRLLEELGPEDPYPYTRWRLLAPVAGYKELILAQVKELCQNYEMDGFWFDIFQAYPNYSDLNKKIMMADGIDIENDQAVLDYSMEQLRTFMKECKSLVLSYNPDASVYFNGVTQLNRENNLIYRLYDFNTKQDLEDLPTTWAGYDIFPIRAKYFAPLGKEIVAMSGKFHTAWGEFGGFKHRDAIKYESAAMVAFGAHVNMGDQLHPGGLMDMTTYENIGFAFDYVEKIEEYGIGANHLARLGIWLPLDLSSAEGTGRMLMEKQLNFVVVNHMADWSDLDVIVIPSASQLSAETASRFNKFLQKGGKLMIMGKAVLNGTDESLLFDIGADFAGDATYDIDYTVAGVPIAGDLIKSPFLNYRAALRFIPHPGTEVMAALREPYFSRTKTHFSSHRNTPYREEEAAHPAVIRKGNIVYAAHDLDQIYFENGAYLHRDLFFSALMQLHERPMVRVHMPSAGRINLLHQPDNQRYILHLLYASPIQRGFAQVIEDMVPLCNTEVELDLPRKIQRAYTAPGNREIELTYISGVAHAVIPEFTAHTGLVLEY